MAIVNRYECDDCKMPGSVVEDIDSINILNNLRCTIRGREIKVDKDKHFCSPACFVNYVHKLITNGNGSENGKTIPL